MATTSPVPQPPPQPEPAPLNRAARRGKARGHDATPPPDRGVGRRAQAAQGRRINPIRRTG